MPTGQKDFFQRAAKLTGRTLSELVIDSTHAAAAKIVQEHEVIRLSREEQALASPCCGRLPSRGHVREGPFKAIARRRGKDFTLKTETSPPLRARPLPPRLR